MLPAHQLARLRNSLLAADYTVDAVLERLGEEGRAGLERNSTVPALDQLGGDDDAQAQLIRLFPLQQEIPRSALIPFIDIDTLLAAGLLEPAAAPERVRAAVDIRPYGFEDDQGEWSGWVVADLLPGMDRVTTPTRPDYVLGVSPASTSLAQMSVPDHVHSALDLGTGCAIQALHLARHADHVVATDLNPRAVRLARLTLALNESGVPVRQGSLYEPVEPERFDLIVTNPPYVMSPPAPPDERLVYRESGFDGDGLVAAVLSGARAHLSEGGLLQVLANWAETAGESWQDRLAGWGRSSGCEMWVLRRERLDIYQYIEMWLTDAGLDGAPEWHRRYREWLEYFNRLGITGVGMGWIMLRNTATSNPGIHIEDWPYEIAQPVGPALSQGWHALDLDDLPDGQLWAACCTVNPDVSQESIAAPGAVDPNYVVLRQNRGLKRAMRVDTALGGVLGACDGELALGTIVDAVASLVDEQADALRQRLLPDLRRALRQGFLLWPKSPGPGSAV
ncbi:methyltransferase [Propionibacterium sp.]|uniref:DUF7059 domain-containing protein n=1 Tax=Propionibacterium sp. TaxID=1977903 RepID=UPI0039EA903C